MKKTTRPHRAAKSADELRPNYRKAKPNRFAQSYEPGSRVVLLEPDVAAVFATPESVNAVLRALIANMPKATAE